MTDTNPTDPNPDPNPADDLGDAGTKALAAERTARKEAEHRAHAAEARIADLERAETRRTVAAEKGLSVEQAKLLSGDDEAAMTKHADELLAAFHEAEPDVRRRPRERLRAGAVPSAEPADSMAQVADSIIRGS